MSTPKFPLSKKDKKKFSDDYELIFLKFPPHNISDEKLVELVEANQEKLKSNEQISKQPPQEGIQDDEDQSQNGVGANGEGIKPEEPIKEAGVIEGVVDEELITARKQYKEIYGEDADEGLSIDELHQLVISKLNHNTASVDYFGLFGKNPIQEMTIEQILSANENERKRLQTAKANEPKKPTEISEFDFDTETEMLIVDKKDPKNKRVINKNTFQFLKGNFDAVPLTPKEIQNK